MIVLKRFFAILTILLPLGSYACVRGPYGPLSNWDHMIGYGYGGGFMWLIILVVIGVVIYLLVQNSKSKGSDSTFTETPLDILKKRYAKGEVEKEEFERKKKDLES